MPPVLLQEVNDALKNDKDEDIAPESVEHLKQLGAYGLQVPVELGDSMIYY